MLIAFEDFLDVLADQHLVHALHDWADPSRKQDPLDQPVRMLHLVDRFVVLVLAELGDAPMLQHPGMQEILVDRGQFVGELNVQVFDHLRISQHP